MTAPGRDARRVRAAGPAQEADVVVVGAGAAGLSLAWRLVAPAREAAGRAGRRAAARSAPEVLLVEPPPGPVSSPARTWCFWEEGAGEFDELVTASWRRMSVTGADGDTTAGTCAAAYKMLRSSDYTRRLEARLAASGRVRRVAGTVHATYDVPGGAEAAAVDAGGRPFRVRGRWVFDSRPPRRLPPARTTLLQHFRGWFLRTPSPRFDASTARLMDFRTGQPHQGLAFVYVLPLAADAALVEYTVFSPSLLPSDAYDRALRRYAEETGLGPYAVTGTEQGVIPMTDGRFPRRPGRRVLRIGGAGGATRPATGYTFAALQRQTRHVAASLRAGRSPVPPDPHRMRHRGMDAVLLRALAAGRVDGAAFFTGLFRRNSLESVVRFLDGRSTLAEEWAIGLRTPAAPMVRTLAELPFVPRRSGPPLPVMPAVPAPPGCGPGAPSAGNEHAGAEHARACETGEDRE
ncbi:lycopene cyclase [Streptomyces daqingensis]|uniref:Lycopene cyclase n=1 Tax=Streptomyces daqingensis TaxID=1472640 RepID=A0ABQ2LZJ6_9ACTN|nr:lycopene cyclase family protein [Streptomyces daqingensis]GGO45054.1 lycopene cyclase [Streptomyces daqingensis]